MYASKIRVSAQPQKIPLSYFSIEWLLEGPMKDAGRAIHDISLIPDCDFPRKEGKFPKISKIF